MSIIIKAVESGFWAFAKNEIVIRERIKKVVFILPIFI
jgi:hypothetical protein